MRLALAAPLRSLPWCFLSVCLFARVMIGSPVSFQEDFPSTAASARRDKFPNTLTLADQATVETHGSQQLNPFRRRSQSSGLRRSSRLSLSRRSTPPAQQHSEIELAQESQLLRPSHSQHRPSIDIHPQAAHHLRPYHTLRSQSSALSHGSEEATHEHSGRTSPTQETEAPAERQRRHRPQRQARHQRPPIMKKIEDDDHFKALLAEEKKHHGALQAATQALERERLHGQVSPETQERLRTTKLVYGLVHQRLSEYGKPPSAPCSEAPQY